jgi:hypothetical protein
MAKVDALLWLANQRPLLETLPHVNEDYAELWSSLRENHSAPASLGGNAVYSQLRNLFKEHAPSGKYSPDLKLVVRVLAAVAESLPDAVAAPADVAVDIPMESIATSSPLPATAAGPAAPLPAGMKGAGSALSAAGAAAAGFIAGAKKMAKAVAGRLESLKLSMRFTRVPEDPSSSAPPPAPPVGVAHEADFNIGDQEISEVAFQTASSQPASAQVDCLAGF